MNKKIIKCLSLLLAISLVMAGCQKTEDASKDVSKDPNEGSASEVKDTVTLVATAEITSLDPYFTASSSDYAMYMNVFDGLIEVNESGEIEPNLAEDWEISDDGLSYTFHLKKGVKFHNGEEFKAGDVVFTCNTAKESPFSATMGQLLDTAIEVDEYTVQINITRPYAPFLQSLSTLQILNEKAVTEAGEEHGNHPIGTGPYKFVNYDLGQKVVFERFDDYHRGAPPIKNLVYRIIADRNTALIALESGDVDYISSIPGIAYESVKNNKDLELYEIQTRKLSHIIMNMEKEPTSNLFVRKAFNHAIDKDTIVQMAVEGLGQPAEYVLNVGTFGYSENVTGYEYDAKKAKEYLEKAGYGNGFDVVIKTVEGFKKDAEIVQEQLGRIGVNATIELSDASALLEEMAQGNYQIAILSISLDADADYWSWVFQTDGMINNACYSNPEVDELYIAGQATTDENERLKIYEELYQIISDDAVIVPLYHQYQVSASNAKLQIEGFDPFVNPYVYKMSWE